jgi:hypothetical protein
VSGQLVGRVLKSDLGAGDANVRLLFVVVAEATGHPRQTDPDGWVRLGTRLLADLIGCNDGKTVNAVIARAEKQGLQVDRPGPNRRMGYRIPPEVWG